MAPDSKGPSFADELLTELRTWTECRKQIVSCHSQPPLAPTYAPVDEQIQGILPDGIDALYRHQAMAIDHALRGEHLTLATATASGKTLALALPSRIRRTVDHRASVLCIAPT